MATGPAIPDAPAVDNITGTSFRIHANASVISNGDGGASLKTMQFLAGLSATYVWVLSPSFSNVTSEQYLTVTQVRDSNGNTVAVKPNTTYYVADVLINSANYANQSNSKAIKTPIAPMDQPTAQPLYNITSDAMRFNLDPDTTNGSNGSAMDNAEVRYGTDSTGAGATIVDFNTTGTVITISGLNPGTTYYFWGRTHNAAGWSAWSNRVSAKTLAELPAAPSSPVISSVTSSSVFATFTNPSNTGGAPVLERQIGYGTSSTTNQYTAASDTTIGSLARFTTYYFWARVRNEIGWGPWSASVAVKTKAQAPAVPTVQLVGNPTTTSIDVNFTQGDNGGDPATTGQIGYGTDPNTPQFFYQTNNTVNTLTALTRNTTYYVWVRAYNADAYGTWSAKYTVKTLADYPSAPSVSLTNVTQLTVHVTVNAGPDDGGSPILEWQLGYGLDPVNQTTFVTYTGAMDIVNLNAGAVYYFWARGRNIRGWGPWSIRSQVTMIAGAQINVGGVWKKAVPFVRQWGLWIRAQPYVRVNGVWKKTS